MLKRIIIGNVFLCITIFALSAFAAIELSQTDATLSVFSAQGSATLSEDNPQATVADTTGGTVNVNYDASMRSAILESTSGKAVFTYSIAKIFMNEGDAVQIAQIQGFNSFSIAGISGEIEITFPDASRVVFGDGATISLAMLADNNFNLNVLEGTVEYTDPDGNTRTLTPNSPAVLVQGFGLVPGWRTTESERNPVTP